MLLKYNSNEKSTTFSNGKGKAAKVTSRIHRKTLRIATKPGKKAPGKKISFGKNQKNFQASKNFPPTTTTLCDNSNDSGLGFDESHHHHSTLTLTSCNNKSSASYHRPLSTLRYSDVLPAPISSTVVKQSSNDIKKPAPLAMDKKEKNITRASTSTKINQSLNLRNETEDTCNSDDFSSYYQSSCDSKSDQMSLGSVSPNETFYLPEKRSSTSGSEGSSPGTISSVESTPPSSTQQVDDPESRSSSSLHKQFTHASRNVAAQLQIITQPEQQHRARYQTEGSRGAVKDRSGNGFPVVKLNGYNKPTTLQVFIGNDVGRVSPHIFYQACKVSGKNSTPCFETKTEGTMVIEIELKPENDMTVICDCVGILKERNVDVEHRLGRNHTLAASVTRNKKKSTKCRMVFRAKINEDSNLSEILQICSNTITCTQPPGVPEICKKSLESCSVIGGKELFLIGKNFLKDTKVTFVHFEDARQPKKLWEETVQPDKEYLQQTHLICVVPPYPNGDSVHEPVNVQIYVTSSNKKSEAHNFVYVPLKKSLSMPQSPQAVDSGSLMFSNTQDLPLQQQLPQNVLSIAWNEPQVTQSDNMMPPPLNMPRKPSFSNKISDKSLTEAPITLKTEFIDQSQHSVLNGDAQQDASTSSTAGLQTPVSVKELLFSNSNMIDVTGMQNSFVTQDTQALIASSQVQDMIEGFKIQTSEGMLIIKNEQSPEHISTSPTAMLPPPPPPQEHNSDQQVVENFLNLIVQSSVMNEPNMVATQTQNHHHVTQDIILDSPSTVTSSPNVALQAEHLVNASPNMILNSAISPSSLLCEPNQMMNVQMVQDGMNTIETSASSMVSNAVSDATAETQAVVKQMIAQVAAEMFSENASEAQSSINNYITNQLSLPPTIEQQQMSNTQQLQEMIVHELNATTLIDKKEETNTQQVQRTEQGGLINAAPHLPTTSAPSTTITQPFSPTTQDLTAMSESDLISFINPSVFM